MNMENFITGYPSREFQIRDELLKVIGKGGFGKVNAVENRNDKLYYAMKRIKKSLLLSTRPHSMYMFRFDR